MSPTMNKKDLIVALSNTNGLSQDKNRSFLDDLSAVADAQLKEYGTFAIFDLVRLDRAERAARKGVAMGVEYNTPAKSVVKAKPIGKIKRVFE